jgi:hypothetical protein
MKKENNFTRTVICMDLTFFILYTPWSIWYVFNRVSASSPSFQSPLISAYLSLIQWITFSIAALNNGTSFFLNLFFNALFRKELLRMMGLRNMSIWKVSKTVSKSKQSGTKNNVSKAFNNNSTTNLRLKKITKHSNKTNPLDYGTS